MTRYRFCVLSGCFVTVLGALMLLLLVIPGLFGIGVYEVATGSMSPGIPPGSIVYTYSSSQLDEGDVIAYNYGDTVILHRVLDIRSDGDIITKGDANPEPDPEPVGRLDIIGTAVFVIPGSDAGTVYHLARISGGIVVLMGLCLVIIGVIGKRGELSILKQRKGCAV